MRFKGPRELEDFIETMVHSQQEIQGEVNVLQKKEMISDIIHKDKLEIGFKLEMEVGKVEARVWQENDAALRD